MFFKQRGFLAFPKFDMGSLSSIAFATVTQILLSFPPEHFPDYSRYVLFEKHWLNRPKFSEL